MRVSHCRLVGSAALLNISHSLGVLIVHVLYIVLGKTARLLYLQRTLLNLEGSSDGGTYSEQHQYLTQIEDDAKDCEH